MKWVIDGTEFEGTAYEYMLLKKELMKEKAEKMEACAASKQLAQMFLDFQDHDGNRDAGDQSGALADTTSIEVCPEERTEGQSEQPLAERPKNYRLGRPVRLSDGQGFDRTYPSIKAATDAYGELTGNKVSETYMASCARSGALTRHGYKVELVCGSRMTGFSPYSKMIDADSDENKDELPPTDTQSLSQMAQKAIDMANRGVGVIRKDDAQMTQAN